MDEWVTVAALWFMWLLIKNWLGRVQYRSDLHRSLNEKNTRLKREFDDLCR